MFLFARNFEEDYQFMMDGIENGTITPERLDDAVTPIFSPRKPPLGCIKG